MLLTTFQPLTLFTFVLTLFTFVLALTTPRAWNYITAGCEAPIAALSPYDSSSHLLLHSCCGFSRDQLPGCRGPGPSPQMTSELALLLLPGPAQPCLHAQHGRPGPLLLGREHSHTWGIVIPKASGHAHAGQVLAEAGSVPCSREGSLCFPV